MGFFAKNFIYNGLLSETYNLNISSGISSSTNNSAELSTSGGASMVKYETKLFRNPMPLLLGLEQAPSLSFDCSISSPDEITASDDFAIQSWLFGQTGYKKLQVCQDDMISLYFNCYLGNPKILRVGNIIYGYDFTIFCDSPFAWEFPRVLPYTYGDDVIVTTIDLQCDTDNNDYTYPILYFKVANVGGSISLTNATDNNRLFSMTGLMGGEEITINCRTQVITSSTGLRRLGNFNYNWFRILRGYNHLLLSANINELSITYSPARKIAG